LYIRDKVEKAFGNMQKDDLCKFKEKLSEIEDDEVCAVYACEDVNERVMLWVAVTNIPLDDVYGVLVSDSIWDVLKSFLVCNRKAYELYVLYNQSEEKDRILGLYIWSLIQKARENVNEKLTAHNIKKPHVEKKTWFEENVLSVVNSREVLITQAVVKALEVLKNEGDFKKQLTRGNICFEMPNEFMLMRAADKAADQAAIKSALVNELGFPMSTEISYDVKLKQVVIKSWGK
jgi:hypothetical protein